MSIHDFPGLNIISHNGNRLVVSRIEVDLLHFVAIFAHKFLVADCWLLLDLGQFVAVFSYKAIMEWEQAINGQFLKNASHANARKD